MTAALIQWKLLRAFLEAHNAGEDPLDALDGLYAEATAGEDLLDALDGLYAAASMQRRPARRHAQRD